MLKLQYFFKIRLNQWASLASSLENRSVIEWTAVHKQDFGSSKFDQYVKVLVDATLSTKH